MNNTAVSYQNYTNCKTQNILGNTIYLITIGGVGAIIFCFSFYVAWHCWLKEILKEMVLDYCCCGLGEYVIGCWEFMGCINNWKSELEEKEDLKEKGLPDKYKYAGLTLEQIEEIKKAEQINKIRLKEAVKINWEHLQKSDVRIEIPTFRPKSLQETHEEEYAVKDDSPSGTPRRRRVLI